jgi:hypothetical protein
VAGKRSRKKGRKITRGSGIREEGGGSETLPTAEPWPPTSIIVSFICAVIKAFYADSIIYVAIPFINTLRFPMATRGSLVATRLESEKQKRTSCTLMFRVALNNSYLCNIQARRQLSFDRTQPLANLPRQATCNATVWFVKAHSNHTKDHSRRFRASQC